jgi:hypothetical protein
MKCGIAELKLFLKIIRIEYLTSIFVIRFFRVCFSIKLAAVQARGVFYLSTQKGDPAMKSDRIVEVNNLEVRFRLDNGVVVNAVKGVSFHIAKGDAYMKHIVGTAKRRRSNKK